jgi:hypothetical protein
MCQRNDRLSDMNESGDTISASATVISNFAAQHFSAAVLFRDHVVRLEQKHAGHELSAFFDEIRSYNSGCILSSVAALEALINELFIAPNVGLRELVKPDFEKGFWKNQGIEELSILKKYEHALSLLELAPFDESENIYQNAKALIELRNALTHFKPLWDPKRQRLISLEDALARKFQLSPFPDDGADFTTMKCMSSGCASWAVETTRAFIENFAMRSGLDSKKMDAFQRK